MVFKARITAKQFAKMTPEQLVSRFALQEGGEAANEVIKARVLGPNKSADGRQIAPKKVKEYKQRELWLPADDPRIIAEVRTPMREKIGRVKEAREDKRYGKAEGHVASNVPPVIFQQIRVMGGVFRSIDQYEAQGLKGGTPIEAKRDQEWKGRYWSQGDVWGFHWSSRSSFLADQGKGDLIRLGGEASRIWAAKNARVQKSGKNLKLVLGFRGRVKGDATQVLADTKKKTKTGRPVKPSPAQIASIANSRDEEGNIGTPAQTNGKPHGGKASLSGELPDASAVRWHSLSRDELHATVIKALARDNIERIRKLPISVVLIEKGARRKVK